VTAVTACPRCGTTPAPEQAWCLSCGLAARTMLVPARGWRRPLAAAAAVAAIALVALVLAFVLLTRNDNPVPPAAAPAAVAPATTTPAP